MTCPNCGRDGAHFVPPSFGDEGFFICKEIRQLEKERARKDRLALVAGLVWSVLLVTCIAIGAGALLGLALREVRDLCCAPLTVPKSKPVLEDHR